MICYNLTYYYFYWKYTIVKNDGKVISIVCNNKNNLFENDYPNEIVVLNKDTSEKIKINIFELNDNYCDTKNKIITGKIIFIKPFKENKKLFLSFKQT